MRQAEVQIAFLRQFDTLYPQFAFRGLRRFASGTCDPFGFVLRVALGKNGPEADLFCVALTEGHPQEVARFLPRVAEQWAAVSATGDHALPVLIAPYLSQEARALCAEAGLGAFDLAGNAHLQTDGLYVDVSGRANPNVRERPAVSPFQGKAERLVRTLLHAPEERWTMRSLAKAAQVSLGLASMATGDLAKQDLVTKTRTGLRLPDPKPLLNAWTEEYDLRRSTYRIYRTQYRVEELERALRDVEARLRSQYALTLWSGAHHLLAEPRPDHLVALYWTGSPEDLALRLGLGERGNTSVFVFEPYDESLLWRSRDKAGLRIVSPLQLYLDLGSGDETELALAERVRERLLGW